jgi:hypothetical protein
MMVDDLISRLRSYGDPNPPCTPEQLQTLSRELGVEIDPFVLALYARYDGQAHTGTMTAEDGTESEAWVEFRLMPVSEVVETHPVFQDLDLPTLAWHAFWTDDNSNYAACYTSGPLRGKVCLIQHDDLQLAPRFRSARSFCTALLQAADEGMDFREFPADYPALTASREEDADDRALALQYAAECGKTGDEEQRVYLAQCAINLLPYAETEPLLAFARDQNQEVRIQASGLLGHRRVLSAMPHLIELLRARCQGGKPDAREEIRHLLADARSYLGSTMYAELRARGVEVRTVRDGFQCRASPDAPWVNL